MLVSSTVAPDTTAAPEDPQGTPPESRAFGIDIHSLKQPSAFVPVTLSLAALLLVLGNSIFLGMGHAGPGSTTDNIFQVVMGAQFPVVIFLIIRRLRRYPKETIGILAVQAAAAFLAFAVDFVLT